ncbi:hypothetical protein KKF32_05130 [Patescibacteria group bacterium]|nr:hypothetical protein [Patescibacteria group bacterium]
MNKIETQLEITQETIKEQIITKLKELQDKLEDSGSLDLILKDEIKGNNLFQIISFQLSDILRESEKDKTLISPELSHEIREYLTTIHTLEFNQKSKTREDIDSADAIIDKILTELENLEN